MKKAVARLVHVVCTLFQKEKSQSISSLQKLKKQGYIFRIPGGSSRNADHSSFCFIYRAGETLEIEVLLVPYNPLITIERKYLDDEFDEVPEGTLHLKVSEQTGFKIYQPLKIQEREFPNTVEQVKAEVHIKHVYATEFFDDTGKRTETTTDGRIAPPEWVPLSSLKKELCPQHKWMIRSFERHLADLSTRKDDSVVTTY